MQAAEESHDQVDFYNSWITREDAIAMLMSQNDAATLKAILVKKLANEEEIDGDDFRLQIHIDFNLEVFRFCVQSSFSAEQTSTLMSIIRYIFKDSLKHRLPTETSFEKLQECLHAYLRDNPPFMQRVFDQRECAQVQRFACQLYKFFMMYEMSMTKFIDFNIITHEPLAALPPDEPLEAGRELDDAQLRSEAVLATYLGTLSSQPPSPAAKTEAAKSQFFADQKLPEESMDRKTEHQVGRSNLDECRDRRSTPGRGRHGGDERGESNPGTAIRRLQGQV